MSKKKSGSLRKTSSSILGLAILLCALISANVIISNFFLRVDLTEDKLFTFAEGTQKIIKSIDNNITFKIFFSSSSKEVPTAFKNYISRVENLLQEYKATSDGKITIEKYDPKPDSDEEEWAQQYGIFGRALKPLSPRVYAGMVAISGKNQANMPFLSPHFEELLEYNITHMIYRIINPKKPIVGVISSLPVMGTQYLPDQTKEDRLAPWIAFQYIGQDYDLRNLRTGIEKIPENFDALILVHPKDLSNKTLYAIDQFLLRGGRLLVFIDPLCSTERSIPKPKDAISMGRPIYFSNIERLLFAWGIGFRSDMILADPKLATTVPNRENQPIALPVWISLLNKNMNKEDILTSKLDLIMMPWPGAFAEKTSGTLKVTPLMNLTDKAGMVDQVTALYGEERIANQIIQPPDKLSPAIRVTGEFQTAFPNGKPGQQDGEIDTSIKAGNSTVILVADVDMLANNYSVSPNKASGSKPLNDNLQFFANAVGQIADSSDLIGIRSRDKFNRPFELVKEMRYKAKSESLLKEEDLMRKLYETREQLKLLPVQTDENQRFIQSPQQKAAIERFRKDEIEIRRDLKKLKKDLNKDIDKLGTKIKVINITLMPFLISIAGCFFWAHRRRKNKI